MTMKIDEVRQRLGVTESAVYYAIRNGRLHTVPGRRPMEVTEEELERYIEAKKHPAPVKRVDHYENILSVGQKFGHWTVLDPKVYKIASNGFRYRMVKCKCACGTERLIAPAHLLSGQTFSCGCLRLENKSKGQIKGLKQGVAVTRRLQKEKLSSKYLNKKANVNSSTGHVGVSRYKNGAYRAYVSIGSKQINLGQFQTLDEAIAARRSGEEKYYRARQERADRIKEEMREKRMATKKTSIYLNPILSEAKDLAAERGLSLSRLLGDVFERYQGMIRMVRLPNFTQTEKEILSEVILGSYVSPDMLRAMPDSIFDAATGSVAEKEALKAKLLALQPIERMAVVDATETGFKD